MNPILRGHTGNSNYACCACMSFSAGAEVVSTYTNGFRKTQFEN
jgi:hypothetical protein